MPFISESVVSTSLLRKAATTLSPAHINIRPLSRPLTKYGVDVPMRTTFMPESYRNSVDAISRTEIRTDDVWVLGFPKSGDVVVQDLVWKLVNGYDGETEPTIGFRERTPLLERTAMTHPRLNRTYRPSWELLERLESPRVLRTNLPMLLLPSGIWRARPRIIYVARHADEVAHEYYQDYVQMQGYKGSAAEFAELLINDMVTYAPYHGHVRDFCELQGIAPNILNVKYSENDSDLKRIIEEVAAFLEIPVTEDRVDELIESTRTGESAKVYREDVQSMDTIFKRTPTVDFEVPRLGELKWKSNGDVQ